MEDKKTHLAIIKTKSLRDFFGGRKRHDFWFGKTKKAPYEDVRQGEEILLKEPGGKIRGKATVENVLFINTAKEIKNIDKYGKIAKSAYRQARMRKVKFVTIIFFEKVEKYLAPVTYRKKDQRRWAILSKK